MDWNYFVQSDISNKLRYSFTLSGLTLIIKSLSIKQYERLINISSLEKFTYFNKLFFRNYVLIETLVSNCWTNETCKLSMKTNTRIIFSIFSINLIFLLIDKINTDVSSSANESLALYNLDNMIKGFVFGWFIFGRFKFILHCGFISFLLGNVYRFTQYKILRKRKQMFDFQ